MILADNKREFKKNLIKGLNQSYALIDKKLNDGGFTDILNFEKALREFQGRFD